MQKNDSENKELSREELKSKLKWGDMKLIAKIADVGISTVERWFKNESNDPDVKAAVEKLREERDQRISERLNDLL